MGLTIGIPLFLAVWTTDLNPWLRPKALTAEAQKVTRTRVEATFMVDLKFVLNFRDRYFGEASTLDNRNLETSAIFLVVLRST